MGEVYSSMQLLLQLAHTYVTLASFTDIWYDMSTSMWGHSDVTAWCLTVWGTCDIDVVSQWWHHSVRCLWHHCNNVMTSHVNWGPHSCDFPYLWRSSSFQLTSQRSVQKQAWRCADIVRVLKPGWYLTDKPSGPRLLLNKNVFNFSLSLSCSWRVQRIIPLHCPLSWIKGAWPDDSKIFQN